LQPKPDDLGFLQTIDRIGRDPGVRSRPSAGQADRRFFVDGTYVDVLDRITGPSARNAGETNNGIGNPFPSA
jgi:hypothetical protein